MDLMKVGLYALAGFGAFAVYNKYIAKSSDTPAIQGTDEPTSSFTGTRWQQDTRTGTNWQQGNVFQNAAGSGCGYTNAAGYVSNPNDNETWGIYRTSPGGATGKQLHSQIMATKDRVVGRSNPNDNETWGIYKTGPGGATGKDLHASIMQTKAMASGMPMSDRYASMSGRGTDWQNTGYSGTDWQEYSSAAGCGGCGA